MSIGAAASCSLVALTPRAPSMAALGARDRIPPLRGHPSGGSRIQRLKDGPVEPGRIDPICGHPTSAHDVVMMCSLVRPKVRPQGVLTQRGQRPSL